MKRPPASANELRSADVGPDPVGALGALADGRRRHAESGLGLGYAVGRRSLNDLAIPDKLSIRIGEPGRVRLRVNQPVGSIRSGMLYLILAVA